jgi:hypothetical protein
MFSCDSRETELFRAAASVFAAGDDVGECCAAVVKRAAAAGGVAAVEDVVERQLPALVPYAATAVGPTASYRRRPKAAVVTRIDPKVAEPPLVVG